MSSSSWIVSPIVGSRWIDFHIETFVKPYLGEWPPPKGVFKAGLPFKPDYLAQTWTPTRVKALLSIWQQAKRNSKGRPILLAGRDVYLFEVLAQLEGVATTFRPDISGETVYYVTEDYTHHYCLDTGYKGTIPTVLKCEAWDLVSYHLTAPMGPNGFHQVFPRAYGEGHVKSIASMLEGLAKYWNRGEPDPPNQWTNGKLTPNLGATITQTMSPKEFFARAVYAHLHVIQTLTGTLPVGAKTYYHLWDRKTKYYSLRERGTGQVVTKIAALPPLQPIMYHTQTKIPTGVSSGLV